MKNLNENLEENRRTSWKEMKIMRKGEIVKQAYFKNVDGKVWF